MTKKKYKVIAIMGKAGSGKDSLQRNVVAYMPSYFNSIISCTTRPMRDGEKEGIDYFFMTNEEFAAADLLETSEFNSWHYGTPSHSLREDRINIGVFNPTGVRSLMKREDIDLTVIYLVANDKQRLVRQLNREDMPNVKEIVRRFSTDEVDFAELSDIRYRLLFNNTFDEFEAAVDYIARQLRAELIN